MTFTRFFATCALLALFVAACSNEMPGSAAGGNLGAKSQVGQAAQPITTSVAPVVRVADRFDTMRIPLRDKVPVPTALGALREMPIRRLPWRKGSVKPSAFRDPLLAVGSSGPTTSSVTPSFNFDGLDNRNGVLPPDTNGDIGPNHYVQFVNLSLQIWAINRATGQHTSVYGPADGNMIWNGFGGYCESSNDGDPIVLYDHLADRWMVSQFALPRFPRGPFIQCIAVSTTSDPTGTWHRYAFTISNTKLNDYPHFGVWPNGYFMSINQFQCSPISCSWGGHGAVAFERDKMLTGDPGAQMVYIDNPDPDLGGMLVADLDGPAPPAGTPALYAQYDDDAWGYWSDRIWLWGLNVDWNNPNAATFTEIADIGVAAADSNLCDYGRNCIAQPGGTNLDSLSDRLMFRLQYRNFGGHQTLLANHTVDVDGSDHAGVRWYELRDSGSGWGVHQQGTYAPDDSENRWMGSIAMNGAGDIALGFSVSSSSTFPSIRFTGRLGTDTPDGTMTQGEGEIVAGGGSQSHSAGRWGDYAMMAVDPTDDCTFWFTTEYIQEDGSAPWKTKIAAIKLADCGPTCTVDSDCGTGQVCCNGACVNPACTGDGDCNDGNECTTGTCTNGGTCTAACTQSSKADDSTCTGGICCNGTCGAAACTGDGDCNDGNECTTGTCSGAGTCAAACNQTPSADGTTCGGGSGLCCSGACGTPACSNDADCDDGNPCTTDSCSGGGACGAACTHTPIANCATCGDGVCAGSAAGEDCHTCSADCACKGRNCSKGCCGDGTCSTGENNSNCPVDCP